MKIIDIKAMKYLEDGSVSCEVLFEGRADYIPYRAVENDSAASGQRVWGTLMSGEFGEIIPFTVTAEMLDKEKELKKEEISRWRDSQENSSFVFEFSGHRWDAGKASQSRLTPVVAVAGNGLLPEHFFWTDADNQDVTLTPEELIQLDTAMNAAMVMQGFKIHERQRRMKEEVAGLTALPDIRAYPVGWPEGDDE
ncbi:DUF4376 domain-containing protein [Escherichia coli]|uniref:DUF4376 domain-containing protein n=1 Tax=Escherichia coli TaxID=562 RepID=UPI0005422B79|nr:DUF4376 domain-containing protein [Escherichia coli]EEZ8572780.1 DUF4376 domain-containing protein [Escherichia coli O113]EEV5566130.1 DUF4376 domain-containing protein [Escherichia coli]EEV5605096.1 DUF4376 domain-containing protein [Escherichia coli]EEY3903383.1 DUF4376 domain-containing protein [Escherichia coli]EEY5882997.1 DUF4376 domain-containing protein [Escherichia coli]